MGTYKINPVSTFYDIYDTLYLLKLNGLFCSQSMYMQHFGQSPLPAYEPAFDWENERAIIFGQRIPETPISQYGNSKILFCS